MPTGVVTLWFADVEGSSGLVHQLGPRYGPVIEQVRLLLRAAVAADGGHEVEARRRRRLSSPFDEPGRGRVGGGRGPARARGRVVAARRRAARAHRHPHGRAVDRGADVLRRRRAPSPCGSARPATAARSCSPTRRRGRSRQPGELRDLGVHDLRGLPEPARILQLVAPGLPLDFPALRVDREAAVEAERVGVKVVLAEDSVLLREGIARLLEDGGFEVVGQAGNADELLLKVRSYSPDVAIVDIRMPPTHTDEGLRAAQEIREKHPGTGVLVLSQYVETGYALDLLADSAEGVGYLLKDRVSDIDEFRSAVRRVAEGGSALDPTVVSQLVGRRRRDDPLADLTPREREVLELMAEGARTRRSPSAWSSPSARSRST